MFPDQHEGVDDFPTLPSWGNMAHLFFGLRPHGQDPGMLSIELVQKRFMCEVPLKGIIWKVEGLTFQMHVTHGHHQFGVIRSVIILKCCGYILSYLGAPGDPSKHHDTGYPLINMIHAGLNLGFVHNKWCIPSFDMLMRHVTCASQSCAKPLKNACHQIIPWLIVELNSIPDGDQIIINNFNSRHLHCQTGGPNAVICSGGWPKHLAEERVKARTDDAVNQRKWICEWCQLNSRLHRECHK